MDATYYTSRRAFLEGFPAASAALTLSAWPGSAEPDPVVLNYHRWLAARREWCSLSELPGNENFDHPLSLAAEARADRAEHAMLAQPPTSAEGIAALVAVSWFYNYDGHTDADRAECAKDMALSPLLSIWRACTGDEGLPVT